MGLPGPLMRSVRSDGAVCALFGIANGRAVCGRWVRLSALLLHQRLKLFGDTHVQLDDALIVLPLAAIPAPHCEYPVCLRVVEDGEQLVREIDHQCDGSIP